MLEAASISKTSDVDRQQSADSPRKCRRADDQVPVTKDGLASRRAIVVSACAARPAEQVCVTALLQDRSLKSADHMLLANYLLKRLRRYFVYSDSIRPPTADFSLSSIPLELRGFRQTKTGQPKLPRFCTLQSLREQIPATLQPLSVAGAPDLSLSLLALQLEARSLRTQQHALLQQP